MKLDILAIGVHPDDVELACSGTLLNQISLGQKVGILDLTRGELGTRGTAETRDVEAAAAKEVIGALVRENLGMADGFFEHSQANLKAIIRVLRRYQPEVVLANALTDRHPDHGRAGKLIADACFLSGLMKIETIDEGKVQEKWRPNQVFHYIQDYHLKPDFVVDITEYMEKKMECILCYKTQFYDPNSTDPETPISGKGFIEFLYGRARAFGRPMGFEFGEGFQSVRLLGVKDLNHIF